MGYWTLMYAKGTRGAADSPIGYACVAIKRELAYNGHAGLNQNTPDLGVGFDNECRAFQKANGLAVDGVVGPNTARALWRKREAAVQAAYGLPAATACGVVSLESANDPGAVGVQNADDRGLAQIDSLENPDLTVAQAFDPAFALDFLGRSIESARKLLNDPVGALASWHVGLYGAEDWVKAGKPATGGPAWSPRLYDEATKYVILVRGQPCP